MNDAVMAKKHSDMSRLSLHIDALYKTPRLRYLFWEATTRCNLSCKHCGSSCSAAMPESCLSAEEICGFLKQFAKDFSPREVMLCVSGGEPLLRGDLFEVMEYASKLGFLWGITTNGLLLTESTVQKMIDTNCKTVSVSLDGLPHSHNELRGSDCFDKTVDGIKLLVSSHGFSNVQVTTVIHKRNIRELSELYALMKSLGLDSWRMTNLEPIGRANQMKAGLLDAEDFTELFEFIRSYRQSGDKMDVLFGCNHYATPEYEMDIRNHFFSCGAGVFVASILCNGDIFACLDIERREELIQGNIKKDSFTEIWNKQFSTFRQRRDRLNPTCAVCTDAGFCRGDAAHTWDYDGNFPKCCLKNMFSYNITNNMR